MQTRELSAIEKEIEERDFKTSEEFHEFLDELVRQGRAKRYIGDKEVILPPKNQT
jgi:hypothetical protein